MWTQWRYHLSTSDQLKLWLQGGCFYGAYSWEKCQPDRYRSTFVRKGEKTLMCAFPWLFWESCLLFPKRQERLGGTNILNTRKMLETAVCRTATLAHFWDLPRGSLVSRSSTSIPVFISVFRIKKAFKKPAEATAKKELSAFKQTSLLPLEAAICFCKAFLISVPPRPNLMQRSNKKQQCPWPRI